MSVRSAMESPEAWDFLLHSNPAVATGGAKLANELLTPSKDFLIEYGLELWRMTHHVPINDVDAIMEATRNGCAEAMRRSREALEDHNGNAPDDEATIRALQERQARGELATEADKQQIEAVLARVTARNKELDEVGKTLITLKILTTPDGQIALTALSRWARSGFPHLLVGQKLAAALMSTKAHASALTDVRVPWPAFLLELPESLLSISNNLEPEHPLPSELKRVLVQAVFTPEGTVEKWMFVAYSDCGLSLFRFGITTTQLLQEEIESTYNAEAFPELLAVDSMDQRSSMLLGRLIVGISLMLTDKENFTEVKHPQRHAQNVRLREGKEPLPVALNIRVGHAIRLDVRDAVRSFVAGQRAATATVQTLVCGHFRRQHHGPRNAQDKIIWIEPYWRGPEDAPISTAVRKVG